MGENSLSGLLLLVFNVITAVLGGAVTGFGAWLTHKEKSLCLQWLNQPILVFGIFVLVVSVVAIIAVFFKIGLLLRIYLVLMLVLIVVLMAFAIFAFIVTHQKAAKLLARLNYKSYSIGDYSNWLKTVINNPTVWAHIRSCIADSKMCFYSYMSTTHFLSDIVVSYASDTYEGCCIPPAACEFVVDYTGMYTTPHNSSASADCTTFNNAQNTRCFDCTSCPGGLLATLTRNWSKLAIGIAIVVGFLLTIYTFGCMSL